MELRTGNPEEAGMSPVRLRRAAEIAERWVREGRTQALVVLVERRGIVVLHEAYGHLTPASDSPPVQRDTLFPLCSITKPIAATAIMCLVEDGIVSLNRPVSQYLPEFTGEGKEAVLVAHLLTHTSGLRDPDIGAYLQQHPEAATLPPLEPTQHPAVMEYISPALTAPLSQPPGREMSYCSPAYGLLGEIIRRVSGLAFEEFVQQRLFEPLGMRDSCFIVPDAAQGRRIRRPADAPCAEWIDNDFPASNCGAWSTVLDLAAFGQMYLNGGSYGTSRLLSPISIAAMTRNQIPGVGARYGAEFFPEASWGYGWSVRENKRSLTDGSLFSPRCFHHGGAGGVFLWVDPTYDILGVYFSVELASAGTNLDLFANASTAAVIDV